MTRTQCSWVGIQEGWGEEIRPFSYRPAFRVYVYPEDGDSGVIVGAFDTRAVAIEFASEWAERWGCQLASADVHPLSREVVHA